MAYWTSLDTGVVSFRKDWERPGMPALRWGEDELPLRYLERAPLSHYGNLSGYFVKRKRVHFILRADRYEAIDLSTEKVYVAGEFNDWEAAIGNAAWQLRPMELDGIAFYGLATKPDRVDPGQAYHFKFVTESGRWLEVPASAPNASMDEDRNRNFLIRPERTGRHRFFFQTPTPLNRSRDPYLVLVEGETRDRVHLKPGVFLKTLATDAPLGALVDGDQTTFRIFAPRAAGVRLCLFETLGTGASEVLELTQTEDLAWEVTVPGNRAGWYYHYLIARANYDEACHHDASSPVLDPYALACVGPLGPGIVVDQAKLPEVTEPFVPPRWHDLVIVEAHVRDLLAEARGSLSAEERRGFSGLRKWVRDRGCYLRELGVNAVELQPVQEFDTVDPAEYGWGYMPVNYFAPASQYALRPQEGSQIEEFRAMVDAFHEAGLAVIIDVVYNHVGVPNYLEFIDKEYYFLLNAHGEYLNYSGCGNTIDPDTAMARRLMRDSLIHFITTFDVDGFRFDLGELLGIDCLGYLEKEVKKVKPAAFLVAEPWSFRAHIGHRFKEIGVAFWHDGFRESIREYLVGAGAPESLAYFMQGSRDDLTAFPAQTVNYVSSHDDRVWIDKITENPDFDGSFPTPNDRRRTHLMAAILLLSVGVPMLHAGTDFLNSKGGQNNTYLDGKANVLSYERQRFFSGTHAYFRQLIAFRQSDIGALLRLDGHPEKGYFASVCAGRAFAMLYNARQKYGPRQILFAINPGFVSQAVAFPGVDWSDWTQVADHERVDPQGLGSACFPTAGESVDLPPLSCGIWVR